MPVDPADVAAFLGKPGDADIIATATKAVPVITTMAKSYTRGRGFDSAVVTIAGSPTGGNFTLTFNGQTTANIAHNATAATVKTALEALSTIGTGNVAVTGGPGPGTPWTVTFRGTLALASQPKMTAAHTLTGGTNPSVTVEVDPNAEIAAVIVTATARMVTNPGQIPADQTAGEFTHSLRGAFSGWTVAEKFVLDRYRVKAM